MEGYIVMTVEREGPSDMFLQNSCWNGPASHRCSFGWDRGQVESHEQEFCLQWIFTLQIIRGDGNGDKDLNGGTEVEDSSE